MGGGGARFALGLQKLFNFNNVLWQSHCLAFLVLPVTFTFQFRPCSLSPILSYFSQVSAFISYHVSSFCSFLSTTTSAIGLVPAHYSPHSFRRGGASFAFKYNVPAQLIHRQGDWQSDAYLTYLNMFLEQKQLAVTSMADYILRLSSVWHFVVNSYLTMAS